MRRTKAYSSSGSR